MRALSLRDQGKRLISFQKVWDLQKRLVDERARDEIEDTLLFVEHTPVITRGKGLQWTGAPREPKPILNLPKNTDYLEIERGGDLTWHGAGQLVLYPIVKLKERDVGGFLRKLEKTLIAWCALYGLNAEIRENATGVWIKNSAQGSDLGPDQGPDQGPEKKIASIGIAIRKWVTYHGIAVNLTNELAPFRDFSPCGFDSEVMARLVDFPEFARHFRTEVETEKTNLLIRERAEKEIASLFSGDPKLVPSIFEVSTPSVTAT